MRVSRYIAFSEQVISQGIQSFKERSGAVVVKAITNLSWEQEQIAKNVTIQMTFSTYEKSIVSRTISIVLVNYCS
jgi:hypothetical protein